jgi:CO/xanthine dehydrogenase FAD-binding subunit
MLTASWSRPTSLADVLVVLAAGDRVIVAGATDFFPARLGRPVDEPVVDITGVAGLREIADEGTGWRIPALATWSDVAEAPLPPLFDGLRAAALLVGGPQVQNAGTVCGNLCNASPAADGIPNLLALDAVVELARVGGTRRVPVGEFVLGNRRTCRRPDELVTAVLVPKPAREARSAFRKLGSRAYLVISIVMAAGVIEVEDGVVASARVAVGACSPVARRLPELEAELVGRRLDEGPDALARIGRPEHLGGLAPIDDVRGSGGYRRDVALTMVRRVLRELAG